jgi:hypothetical protein
VIDLDREWPQRVIRQNAESMLVWHGRDAEALQMESAKQCIADGYPDAVKPKMRIVREIRRLLAKDEKGWLEKHRTYARSIAEARARDAARGFPWPETV